MTEIDVAKLRSLAEQARNRPDSVEWQRFWDELTEDHILALLDRLEQAEAKPPAGWSSEDQQESKQEAERRWSGPVMREPERRYQAGCINGFMLGAEWQKARETFISYRVIAGEAVSRAERAEAAIERARETHKKVEVFAGADFRPLTECSRCGDDEPYVYPCATVAALDTGKEASE